MWFKPKTETDRVFELTILLKAIDGVLEIIGGLLLFIVKPASIAAWVAYLTQHELSQDPSDFVASHVLHSAQTFAAATSLFAGLYLLTHGITKIILVVEILRGHLWAFRGMVVFLGVSIAYQLYRIMHRPSWSLALLTLFDVLVAYLTLKEESRIKSRL